MKYEISRGRAFLFFLLPVSYFLFAHPSAASTRTSIQSGAWSSPATWNGGTAPIRGDSVWIAPGDSVFLNVSTAPLSRLIVQGVLLAGANTIFLDTNFTPQDTILSIQGTLDAGSGWITVADTTVSRPLIHIHDGGLFRTKASLPYDGNSIYDSLRTPLFICDTASTFEYYSDNLDLIDVSYLANNLIGHAYGNLALNGMVASFRANPVAIVGTLHIEFGASLIPNARKGSTIGYDTQYITISGNVVNDNEGESGAPGAGLHGCGMQSFSSDVWTFSAGAFSASHEDTCYWSGPSQIGSVIIQPNTVLSVRFYSDTACDSLDILGTLDEKNGPCGGHLIGRVFSEFPAILDASHPVDSFGNIGMTLRSGTDPYLGRTHVVRTSGYAPPGSNPSDRPVSRYYSITPGAGPQQGIADEMTFRFHCDEGNNTDPAKLHFWRSRDRGGTWAYSGLMDFDPATNSYTWDTTTVGFPNDSGSFYWMLSEGYTDIPLPIDLQSFEVQPEENHVLLEWQTASEIDISGFEIERTIESLSAKPTLIASYQDNSQLLSRSKYGADYSYSDPLSDTGIVRYDLYEISQNAVRMMVASQAVRIGNTIVYPALENLFYHPGELQFTLNAPDAGDFLVSVTDAIGRQIFSQRMETPSAFGAPAVYYIPMKLAEGNYFVSVNWNNSRVVQKMEVKNP